MSAPSVSAQTQLLPSATELGPVHLSVTEESKALRFYEDVVGLTKLPSRGGRIHLGTPDGRELVILYPGATKPFLRGRTGLYHLALAVPNLRELARVEARLSSLRYPNYPTDHTISKSIYLWDPDSNGIEIYKETPEDGTFIFDGNDLVIRDREGNLRSGRDPIDLDWLLGHLKPEDRFDKPIPDGTSMGHVHLHVADLDKAMRFYGDLIGYQKAAIWKTMALGDVTLNSYLPHRLAFNMWAGQGASPAPEGSSGLRHFTMVLPTTEGLDAVVERLKREKVGFSKSSSHSVSVQDPSRNQVQLTVGGGKIRRPGLPRAY